MNNVRLKRKPRSGTNTQSSQTSKVPTTRRSSRLEHARRLNKSIDVSKTLLLRQARPSKSETRTKLVKINSIEKSGHVIASPSVRELVVANVYGKLDTSKAKDLVLRVYDIHPGGKVIIGPGVQKTFCIGYVCGTLDLSQAPQLKDKIFIPGPKGKVIKPKR